MTKINKLMNACRKYFVVALLLVLAFTLNGCKKDKKTPTESVNVTINLTLSKETIEMGETVKATVTVEATGTKDKTYTLTSSDDTLVSIANDEITVIKDIVVDKIINITATSNADNTKKSIRTIKVKAPVVEGQVGELTSEMIQELGNESITVKGVLTDYYTDFNQSANNQTTSYDISVEMSKNMWSGSWNYTSDKDNVITDTYRRGSVDGLQDQYGNIGHALERMYIDKNNTVSVATEKDYLSRPAIWEAQHLWNHIGQLSINKFEYDAENEVYEYKYDSNSLDDLYLMTYLSFSLTPLLEDTLVKLYFVIEDGVISKMLAETEKLYYGSDTSEDADGVSYTTIELNFSKIGTTEVKEPAAYEAPEYADKLVAALAKMGDATNYTFRTKDVMTRQPSTDSDDYEMQSTGKLSRKGLSIKNNTSSVGTVGCVGQVTQDAVLFADTIQYSYTLDGNSYRTEYTGYKQNDDNTYDLFAYDSKKDAMYGTKKIAGNIHDNLPSFDFSANIFKFVGLTMANGTTRYTYTLKETSITRDIALEVSAYKYADDASASATSSFQIIVDDNGNIISTRFPYSLVSGTYMGYCTTTYDEVGTTTLPEDLFDGYTPRVLNTSWSQYTDINYSPTYSTQNYEKTDGQTLLEIIYGSAASSFPSPSVFMEILGDNINGPWYDWATKGTNTDGTPKYIKILDFTAQSTEYDENNQILNYYELMDKFEEVLGREGFTLDVANTDTTGGESGRSNRYVCFIKGDIQIVIENNFTRYLWISCYKTGDWTLSR